MKEEIVRVMDELGRVVIPAEYRSALGWAPSCKLSISRQDGQLILRAYEEHLPSLRRHGKSAFPPWEGGLPPLCRRTEQPGIAYQKARPRCQASPGRAAKANRGTPGWLWRSPEGTGRGWGCPASPPARGRRRLGGYTAQKAARPSKGRAAFAGNAAN